jgi:hypothetical protein
MLYPERVTLQERLVESSGFTKPLAMPEEDYMTYKQFLMVYPAYKIGPKSDFWGQFPMVKWSLIIITVGIVLGLIYEKLFIITKLAMFFLFLALVQSEARAMFSYFSLVVIRQRFYDTLKKIIIESEDYGTFIDAYKKL